MTEIEINLSEMGMWGTMVLEERLERAEAELQYLRRIEKAVLNGQTHADAAERFRAVAREFVLRQDRAPLFAIADALEGVGDNVDG